MEKRPKIKTVLTTADKITEIFGLLTLIFMWFLSIYNYADLPEIIPVHYNGSGEADAFGNKIEILTLPMVASVIFIVLTTLNFFPHFSTIPAPSPKKISKNNTAQEHG